jgi:hypothetical protein
MGSRERIHGSLCHIRMRIPILNCHNNTSPSIPYSLATLLAIV